MKKILYITILLFVAGIAFCLYSIDYKLGVMAGENLPFLGGIFGGILGIILSLIFLKADRLQENLKSK
ncbi:hypothetical protein ACF3NR_06245 [Vaginella massiliensis]|uniref:hypothetical protein n=1 Tax=Vaginella massiliensis TaxID=1816680 RepID=UPI0012B5251A|nr:hypothetical protein [Vaginella massiliensis]